MTVAIPSLPSSLRRRRYLASVGLNRLSPLDGGENMLGRFATRQKDGTAGLHQNTTLYERHAKVRQDCKEIPLFTRDMQR